MLLRSMISGAGASRIPIPRARCRFPRLSFAAFPRFSVSPSRLPAFPSFSISSSSSFSSSFSSSSPSSPLVSELLSGVLSGDRSALSRSITLVESCLPSHEELANELLLAVLAGLRSRFAASSLKASTTSQRLHSFRVGISGPPGVGKSSFIEVLGMQLANVGHKVAVLTVDPSSSITGGSILGDKTRMTELSRHPAAYIRPSPTWGTTGGLNRATPEVMTLCEGAGYDLILVETVGVGQSETAVRDTVDVVLLLVPPAGGDEIQGLKKGIVEIADIVVVNKADGELLASAQHAQVEYLHALQLNRPRVTGWTPTVLACSTLDAGVSIRKVWQTVLEYKAALLANGELFKERARQRHSAMLTQLQQEVLSRIRRNASLHTLLESQEAVVLRDETTPRAAARTVTDSLFSGFVSQPQTSNHTIAVSACSASSAQPQSASS